MSERLKAPGFALKVIWPDGKEGYLCDGVDGKRPSRFFSRKEAQSQKDFMLMGMEGDVQSINVVPYPRARAGKEGGR